MKITLNCLLLLIAVVSTLDLVLVHADDGCLNPDMYVPTTHWCLRTCDDIRREYINKVNCMDEEGYIKDRPNVENLCYCKMKKSSNWESSHTFLSENGQCFFEEECIYGPLPSDISDERFPNIY